MKNANETLASMINSNLLDESLTTEQVQSVLTDAYNEAVQNGDEPEYDVAELVAYWDNHYDNNDNNILENLYEEMQEDNSEFSQIEQLALLNMFGDRTEYKNKFNNCVSNGLENWFIELSNEELNTYEVTENDFEFFLQNEDGVRKELQEICNTEIKKLLISALEDEKNRR